MPILPCICQILFHILNNPKFEKVGLGVYTGLPLSVVLLIHLSFCLSVLFCSLHKAIYFKRYSRGKVRFSDSSSFIAGCPKAALQFGSLVILDVVCHYLSLFLLYINIKIDKNRC